MQENIPQSPKEAIAEQVAEARAAINNKPNYASNSSKKNPANPKGNIQPVWDSSKRPSMKQLAANSRRLLNNIRNCKRTIANLERINKEHEMIPTYLNHIKDYEKRLAQEQEYIKQFAKTAFRCSLPKKKQRELGIIPVVGRLEIVENVECPTCRGEGSNMIAGDVPITCDSCIGSGYVSKDKADELLKELQVENNITNEEAGDAQVVKGLATDASRAE